MSGEGPQDDKQSSTLGDPEKEETWQRRIDKREIEFPYLVQLRYWQELKGQPKLKALGDSFYDQALDVFRAKVREDGLTGSAEVNVAIFGAAGCGVYLSPDGKFRYTVFERAIQFDWSAAHMLLLKVDGLARHSRELWRTNEPPRLGGLKPAAENQRGKGNPILGWWAARREARRTDLLRRMVDERKPHGERAYELCTSVFSAVNLEKIDRAKRGAGEEASQLPSADFEKRVDVIRPEVADAAATFKQAAQRYARGRYGRGMLFGMGIVGLACAAMAVAFSAFDVPAWYGIALLGGALGATVSVLQRMASDQLRLDFDAGSGMLMALGVVRPLIGAVFGMVLFCAIDGGWLPSIEISPGHALSFYAVLGFLAGFNERFAQDMLVASAAQLGSSFSSGGPGQKRPDDPEADGPAREDPPQR